MAEDREVLREIWESRIPICFKLDPEEVETLKQPDPYMMMVPRLTYFPLVTDKVKKHFGTFVREMEGDMWLEAEPGVPLKWHYPVGLLFDLLEADTPWQITVHFKNYPEDQLFLNPSRAAVESHFMCTLKEADALKHRKQLIGNMQKRDTNQLWFGFCNDKFDQFWAANKLLMEHPPDQTFKAIPLRIYRGAQEPFLQRFITPQHPSGEHKTLAHLLEECLPSGSYRVISHDIEVPQDIPLQWLSEHMSYPDNFLHLCVFPAKPQESS